MNISVPVPDDIAERLGSRADLARRALEAFAAEEFRAGRLTGPELRRMLGFGTRWELDGFLKARGIFLDYSMADLEREQQDLIRLGF